ncbi:TIGR03016 family PEP-CTERM system-associated outer membrane protein [Paraglaciecola aquimarina]|uniref:TIGR03016 family PEP-CTERM system-associated outer membrane protein n=1 Tax=Paraglaciecola algarum TaxID=3050085 RepID=A0ABS9D4A9_9ALTE|nr:TIGR03016 family PEP-CTERM system-associated outer membrane protein [Paraglaciecola sp. G1-23]
MVTRTRQSKKLISILINLLLLGGSCSLFAGDLQLNSNVSSTAILYETKINDETDYTSNQALVIKPQLSTVYTSKGLKGSILAEHTFVEQKDDREGADKSFTDLEYNSQLTLIENAMYIGIQGNQSYRVISQIQEGIGDKILAPGELTKYRRNGANFRFNIPNPKYIGLSMQTQYSEVKTDESLDSFSGLDTKNISSSVNLFQGRNARGYRFNISGQSRRSERSLFNDFTSNNINGLIGLSIGDKTDFVITGNISEYDIDRETSTSTRIGLDTNSYGAGFEWMPSAGRNIRLTYNQLEQFDQKTQFIGLNAGWAFSTRTAISLDIGKQFYGNSYKFSLNQRLKHFSVSMDYNESVTSYGLLNTDVIPSLFVCSLGSTELADCFQADSTDYELQAGEVFLPVNLFETNISEEVFLRKAGSFSLGYQKRKVKISIASSYGKTEYLESDRELANRKVSLNISYQLGRKSDISVSSGLSRRSTAESIKDDTIKTLQVSYTRNLTQKMKLDLTVRALDRKSESLDRDLSDNRLSAGLNYTF